MKLGRSSGSAPNELKLTSELLLPPNNNGNVVFVRHDVDPGTWHFPLDAVAAFHGDKVVPAAVVDGDLTVHVVTDMIQISLYFAPRPEDDIVQCVPTRVVCVTQEPFYQVRSHPACIYHPNYSPFTLLLFAFNLYMYPLTMLCHYI